MWTSLGNPGQAAADLAPGINGDGRLEVFALTTGQQVWHNWQVSPGGDWAGWSLFSSESDTGTAIGVAENADGRLEIFRLDTSGAVLHSWQLAPNAGWSAWDPLSVAYAGELVMMLSYMTLANASAVAAALSIA